MKRVWSIAAAALAILAVAALASCAGVPKPASEADTLVVGSLELAYPDGFFNAYPRTIGQGVKVDFVNTTTGSPFFVVTSSNGYFHFLSNGSDSYEITGFAWEVREGSGTYSGDGKLKGAFTVQPHRVHYLGHLTYTYAKPSRETTDTRRTYWRFQESIDLANEAAEMKEYLQAAAQDSPWLSYDVDLGYPK